MTGGDLPCVHNQVPMRRAIELFRRCTESLDRVVCHSLSHVRVIPKRRSRNFSRVR